MAAAVLGIRCRWEGGVAKDSRTDFSIYFTFHIGFFLGGAKPNLKYVFVLMGNQGEFAKLCGESLNSSIPRTLVRRRSVMVPAARERDGN